MDAARGDGHANDPARVFGAMVTCNSYRNPDLLADMARTVDHISGGPVDPGYRSGWFDRDYQEYGYEFGTGSAGWGPWSQRSRIKARLAKLNPPPIGPLPILIGGGGEKVTLRLVAEHADMWNSFGPPETYARKNAILTEWCSPAAIRSRSSERCSSNRMTSTTLRRTSERAPST